eukprot:CAMPEP_0172307906 /NCGR_PEP_ID=MMETSP1058-20130122/8664_1 /TAXON_ID=83371 /ORGANISM="Detonula confervacea, Strain CCMP 353" /LENGTH=360 /DNA_ID=CAMNT_0013020213 /DNA_START=124 /DNA_END=1206 /DNA_ORIENTATION=+
MWDLKCLAAAICFLTSNILFIVHGALVMKENNSNSDNTSDGNTMHFSFESWKDLDPSYIETRWANREQQRPIMMSAALIGAVAWFWLIVPIVQSAWVLSRGGKRSVGVHMLLAALAICGGIIELLARLLTVGMTNASMWLAKDFNLDNWDSEGDGTGWRVLEMIHIVTRGLLLWIDAFEALALFGIVVVIFYSVATEPKFKTKRSSSILVESEDDADVASGSSATATSGVIGDTELSGTDNTPSSPPPSSAFAAVSSKVPVKPTFTKCFAWYGLFVGLLAIVDFLADVLRFVDWKVFGRIAMATNALLGVIFLPIWLLCLASQLPGATERFEREERRASIFLSDLDDEKSALTGKERVIS